MFSPSNTFFLWGHGADQKRGEYRLKADEYLLMAGTCGKNMTWSLYESEEMMKALENNTHLIPIPDPVATSIINVNDTDTNSTIYTIPNLQLYRPKSNSLNNPAYYKLPEIWYQPFNILYTQLKGDVFDSIMYDGYLYTQPLDYFLLSISGIQRPGTVFKWPVELVNFNNGIDPYIYHNRGRTSYAKSFEIIDTVIEHNNQYSGNYLKCLFPKSALTMSLEQADAADPLSRRFAQTIRAAYSISFLTLDDICLDIFRRTGDDAHIIDIINYLMNWKDIYSFIRMKDIAGPIMVIHKICRSLDLIGVPDAPNTYPKSFNSAIWSRTGVNARQRIINRARTLRNPRNNGYTSSNNVKFKTNSRHRQRYHQSRKRKHKRSY
jgi:hypothetical protein